MQDNTTKWQNTKPVSYTHLDVYKRQLLNTENPTESPQYSDYKFRLVYFFYDDENQKNPYLKNSINLDLT